MKSLPLRCTPKFPSLLSQVLDFQKCNQEQVLYVSPFRRYRGLTQIIFLYVLKIKPDFCPAI